jgi:hypothetical protein
VLGVDNVGANALAGAEGASNDDNTLLNCIEHVRYAKVLGRFALLG